MKIAVDAMGGDHAPDEIVRGALLYREKGGPSDLVLVGREDPIRKLLGAGIPPGITIRAGMIRTDSDIDCNHFPSGLFKPLGIR